LTTRIPLRSTFGVPDGLARLRCREIRPYYTALPASAYFARKIFSPGDAKKTFAGVRRRKGKARLRLPLAGGYVGLYVSLFF